MARLKANEVPTLNPHQAPVSELIFSFCPTFSLRHRVQTALGPT